MSTGVRIPYGTPSFRMVSPSRHCSKSRPAIFVPLISGQSPFLRAPFCCTCRRFHARVVSCADAAWHTGVCHGLMRLRTRASALKAGDGRSCSQPIVCDLTNGTKRQIRAVRRPVRERMSTAHASRTCCMRSACTFAQRMPYVVEPAMRNARGPAAYAVAGGACCWWCRCRQVERPGEKNPAAACAGAGSFRFKPVENRPEELVPRRGLEPPHHCWR